MENKIIAGYARVSTQRQVDFGVSIDMQKNKLLKQFNELKIEGAEYQEYVDEGKSAKSLNRPAMQQLLDDIKEGKVIYLISYSLDRLSRDIADASYIRELCSNHNVKIMILNGSYSDECATDRLGVNMRYAMSQFEREIIAERTNDGLKTIAENGRYPCGGKVLYGYERNDNKEIIIIEEEAKIVKKIFELAIKKNTLLTITRQVNEMQESIKFNQKKISIKGNFIIRKKRTLISYQQ